MYLMALEIGSFPVARLLCVGMYPMADIGRVVIAILRNIELYELIAIIYVLNK